jgi:hypothetical protein
MNFSFKINGLDRLQKRLDDLKGAIASLDGEFANLSVEHGDEASATAAIATIYAKIDERLGPLRTDRFVAGIVSEMKTVAAAEIRARAGL